MWGYPPNIHAQAEGGSTTPLAQGHCHEEPEVYFLAQIFAKLKATRQPCEVPQLGMGSVDEGWGSGQQGGGGLRASHHLGDT